jgi:hypothetical protein
VNQKRVSTTWNQFQHSFDSQSDTNNSSIEGLETSDDNQPVLSRYECETHRGGLAYISSFCQLHDVSIDPDSAAIILFGQSQRFASNSSDLSSSSPSSSTDSTMISDPWPLAQWPHYFSWEGMKGWARPDGSRRPMEIMARNYSQSLMSSDCELWVEEPTVLFFNPFTRNYWHGMKCITCSLL